MATGTRSGDEASDDVNDEPSDDVNDEPSDDVNDEDATAADGATDEGGADRASHEDAAVSDAKASDTKAGDTKAGDTKAGDTKAGDTEARGAPPPAVGDGAAAMKARRARGGAWLALVGALVLPAALLYAWSREMPVGPREMPALTLSPSEVAAQLAEDAADAAAAPDGELALERARHYRDTNVGEFRAADYPGRAELRRQALAAAMDALREAEGPDVVRRIRAADLERLEPALHGEIPEPERVEVLGGFTRMMHRYSMLDEERQTAPRFVVRTVFKARWNAMHGLELTDGFSPVEARAYFGWLALHADGAPVQQRVDALDTYAAAGGSRAEEARAVLLFDEGRLDEAAEAFAEAYRESPTFRLRNHAHAAATP